MVLMADAAWLPRDTNASHGAAILAGYLPSAGAAHAWTPNDWARAKAWPNVGWLVPIAVYARGQRDPGGAARDAADHARNIGAPAGSVIVLDVEQGDSGVAAFDGFPRAWGAAMQSEGFTPWGYTSRSTAHNVAPLPAWLAEWTNQPHDIPGAVATQWASPTSNHTLAMDLSSVPDVASLWSLRQPQEHPMTHLAAPVVCIVDRPQGDGYWLVCADGGVFAYHAPALGSLGGKHLAAAIVDAKASPTGEGLWLVGADGGVFALGDASFHGSIPGSGIGPAPGTPGDPTP